MMHYMAASKEVAAESQKRICLFISYSAHFIYFLLQKDLKQVQMCKYVHIILLIFIFCFVFASCILLISLIDVYFYIILINFVLI